MAKKKSHKLLGFATLAAAILGAYFLYGKEAGKRRNKAGRVVKSWTLKAKAEVLEQLERAQELSERTYHDILEKVERKYRALQHVDKKELQVVFDDLRAHWLRIKKQIEAAEREQEKKHKKY